MSLCRVFSYSNMFVPSAPRVPAHVTVNYFIHSDEWITLETSALKLFTVANLCYKLS